MTAFLAAAETPAYYRLVSLLGLAVLIGIAWVLSTNRKGIRWRPVAIGVGLQLLFGVIVLSPMLSEFFFVVVDGAVVPIAEGPRRRKLAVLERGEFFGEIGLLVPGPASATVKAKTPMTLLAIPHDRFGTVLEDTPGLGLAIARELAQRLHDMDARMH